MCLLSRDCVVRHPITEADQALSIFCYCQLAMASEPPGGACYLGPRTQTTPDNPQEREKKNQPKEKWTKGGPEHDGLGGAEERGKKDSDMV